MNLETDRVVRNEPVVSTVPRAQGYHLFLLNYDVMFARMSALFMNESTLEVDVLEKHAIFMHKKKKTCMIGR